MFLLICTELFAPQYEVFYLIKAEVTNAYDRLIKAVVNVESGGNVWALNITEQAVGAFQIRAIRVAHFNKLTGKQYTIWDMYNYNIAQEVFLQFAIMKGLDYEAIARSWNGRGEMTDIYWEKVKARL